MDMSIPGTGFRVRNRYTIAIGAIIAIAGLVGALGFGNWFGSSNGPLVTVLAVLGVAAALGRELYDRA